MRHGLLSYGDFRFLKWALVVIVAATVAYVVHVPLGSPNGGTWLGYGLGGTSATLVLWLTYFGIRKRRYGPGNVNLRAWLSAHVYLGLSLLILATLHSGFQFGLNIHTLAYTLMVLVILSGVFGVYTYVRYPAEITENRSGETLREMLLQIADLDQQCRSVAVVLDDRINNVVFKASQETRIGGGLFRQLSGRDSSCATKRALEEIERLAPEASGENTAELRQLAALLSRKSVLLRRARQDVRFQALMQAWLFLHVPLTVGLLAALTAHVVSVFFYW